MVTTQLGSEIIALRGATLAECRRKFGTRLEPQEAFCYCVAQFADGSTALVSRSSLKGDSVGEISDMLGRGFSK